MLGALIIVFREVLEAGLIIGVMLAATKGVPGRGKSISFGIALGVIGAGFVALFAGFISGLFHGSGQELMNACALFGAVAMLAWHNIWMSTHGREMARDARELGAQVVKGKKTLAAITGVVAIAVLREGSEVVLFLYGLLASDGGTWKVVFTGGMFGLLLGALSTALIYWGLVAIPVRHFFSATTLLITFLASGLAAQGIAFLQQAGYLAKWSSPVWDTSGFISQSEWFGRLLHTLIGYCDQPTGMQLIAYGLTLFGISAMLEITKRQAKPVQVATQA